MSSVFTTGLSWVLGNAEELPFDDDKFDVYTIAFGIRNVTRIDLVSCCAVSSRGVLMIPLRFFTLVEEAKEEFLQVKEHLCLLLKYLK